MALGTDTGGSIRIPSSFCGATGIKPTYSRVSRYGVLPLAFSLDHVGPICSCIEDCALTMNVIAGNDPKDATCSKLPVPDVSAGRTDLKQVRIGVPTNFFFERIDDSVSTAVRRTLDEARRLGASVMEIRVPDMAALNAVSRVIQLTEVAAVYARHTNRSLFGVDVWSLIQQGRAIAGYEYVNAQRLRSAFRREFDSLWDKIDVLATPTTPMTAPGLSEEEVQIGSERENTRMASTRLVRAINCIGEPAISMPCGTGANGMPAGLQLIGPPFNEANLLEIAGVIEKAISFRAPKQR
jgi:aspartyl-tRNA(Asn)/glutamyl-tRNA(Gln) amidotransferase subunit A